MNSTLLFSSLATLGFACTALELSATPPYLIDTNGLSIWSNESDVEELAKILDECGVEAEDFTVVKKTDDDYDTFRAALDAEAEAREKEPVLVGTLEIGDEEQE